MQNSLNPATKLIGSLAKRSSFNRLSRHQHRTLRTKHSCDPTQETCFHYERTNDFVNHCLPVFKNFHKNVIYHEVWTKIPMINLQITLYKIFLL